MIHRTRFLITAAAVCHLLVVLLLVTSRLHAQSDGTHQDAGEELHLDADEATQQPLSSNAFAPILVPLHSRPPASGSRTEREVTLEADQQEKTGSVYRLTGDVRITYGGLVLRADEIRYDSSTGEATATGHIILEGGPHDEHIEAARATYNVRTQTGRFYEVFGTTGMRFRGSSVQLTSATPFYFQGKLVERAAGDRIIVHQGRVTSCQLPHPKWVFAVSKADVEVGNEARLYHSTFRIFGLPVFYLPYLQHPVNRLGRQSGFLIPTIGQSSRKGTILGESFYWAINRSMDATVGAEYFSHRGWAQHGEFRSRPSRDSHLNADYYGVLDRGTGTPRVDQGGEDIHVNGEVRLPHDIRGVADLEYLSSFVFRLAFAQSFTEAVNSEVRSNAFASKAEDGFFFNVRASRYQNFQSANRGDLITLVRVPSLELDSAEHTLAGTPLHWSYDAAIEGVSRREPGFVTAPLVGRADLLPRLSLPVFLRGWSFRPEVGLRETYYTQSRTPAPGLGQVLDLTVNRRALEASLEVRPPTLSRIFDRKLFGHTLKHTIEPRLTYRMVTGVDNAAEIIRFDWRDILSDTSEVEYGIVNRLYAKGSGQENECTAETSDSALEAPPAPAASLPSLERGLASNTEPGCQPGPASAREVVRWEVGQKAFLDETFGGALIPGQRNVFTTTADFTGIAFLTAPRRFSPIISRLRIDTSRATDVQWNLDYDVLMGRINASTAIATLRVGEFFLAGSHAFLRTPGEIVATKPGASLIPAPSEFNQFRWLAGYGSPTKRGVSVAANIGFDVFLQFLQYSAFQASYNWDCCGINFEYRRFALGSVRNENQFRVAFSLTNVGTFGNLRRQERLF